MAKAMAEFAIDIQAHSRKSSDPSAAYGDLRADCTHIHIQDIEKVHSLSTFVSGLDFTSGIVPFVV